MSDTDKSYYKRLRRLAGKMKQKPTIPERLTANFLVQNSIPFKAQRVICPYIIDFLLTEKAMVIEIDGGHHYQNMNQMSYDTERDALLMSLKLLVIRLRNEELEEKLPQILEIYHKRKSINTSKFYNILGHHNSHYQSFGFDTLKIKYLKRYFAIGLSRTLNKFIKIYKFKLRQEIRGQSICSIS